MPNLYFDTATLHRTGIRAAGRDRTFAQLGANSSTLRVYARQLTVESVPDRHLDLAADLLTVTNANAFASTKLKRRVHIAAEKIVGPVVIHCPGVPGTPGAKGTKGKAAHVINVVVDSENPDIREPKLIAPPTAGGRGGDGTAGGTGGSARVWFCSTLQGIIVSAKGGKGGARGAGGDGGTGHPDVHPASGAKGPDGHPGTDGVDGTAETQVFSSPKALWARWDPEIPPDSVPLEWAEHRLRVAEYLFRTGAPENLKAAREHLVALAPRVSVGAMPSRIHVLLQRLFEHVTFCGMPRDIDISADVAFVSQDNDTLVTVARQMITDAQVVVSQTNVQDSFARFADNAADQAANTRPAAQKRVDQANAALATAVSRSDLARARVKSLNDKVSDLQKVIAAEHEANSGPFAQMMQIVDVGVSLGSAVAGVATGVGAVAAVGRGFATLQGIANSATDVFDLVGDVKRELNNGSLKKFKTGLKDLKDGTKSIFDVGSLIGELDGISSNHPDPRMREIAETQRESVLLNQEVALNTQMEKEARLGGDAATAERDAIDRNAALSRQLAHDIRASAATDIDEIVRPLLVSLRQLLDMLSIRLFLTQRAREIYLAEDPTTVVRHDFGHVHPDVERMLGPAGALNELRQRLDSAAPEVIEWSSLVGDMLESDAAGLSRTPISLWFSTTDPALLDPLRTTGALGFSVPIEALTEEDGSQLYEVKFDGVRVILHGAKFLDPNSSGQSIKLRQLGRWSVRRRPDGRNPNGVIKDFSLREREAHLACRLVPGGVEAELLPPFNPGGQPPANMWGRGTAGEWELSDIQGLDFAGVTRVEIEFRNQALSQTTFAGRGAPGDRLLRPLPGWPVPKPLPRSGIPVPPRLLPAYGYRYGVGTVAAVGAALV